MSSIHLPPIVGLDIGRSAVKLTLIRGGRLFNHVFRTAVCPAKEIIDKDEAARAELETVTVGRTRYWVGETAVVQRAETIGLSDEWIASDHHAALVLYANKWLQAQHGVSLGDGLTRVVMGLPSKAMSEQKAVLEGKIAEAFPHCKLRVIPQPNGPFYDLMFQNDGMPNPQHNLSNESWAVIDVGYQTTDMMLMRAGGRFVVEAADSCVGVSEAADHLLRALQSKKGFFKLRLMDMDQAFRVGTVKYNGKIEDVRELANEAQTVVVSAIVDKAQQLFAEDAHMLDGILIAGGGSSMVYPQLKAEWPHAVLADDSRQSIARGFARFGAMLELLEAMQKSRQVA